MYDQKNEKQKRAKFSNFKSSIAYLLLPADQVDLQKPL